MCKYTYLPVFWFGHFPRSGIESESNFLIKCYIITVLNFYLGAFRSVFKKVKKWIFHCILKKWFGWGGTFFCRNFFLKNPNTPEYAQVLLVTCPKLISFTALLSPPPYILSYNCSKITKVLRNKKNTLHFLFSNFQSPRADSFLRDRPLYI